MLRGLGAGLLALLAVLALAAETGAKPRTFSYPGSQTVEFHLRGSDGYRIDVGSVNPRFVSLTASRWRGAGLTATYVVARRPHGERGFEARLPGLGRIAVEFEPTGRTRRVPPLKGCTGPVGRLERGRFLGTVRFRGERGYTEVRASTVRGRIITTYRQTCEAGDNGPASFKRVRETQLSAVSQRGKTFFGASLIAPGGPRDSPVLTYWASQISRVPGMQIIRSAVHGEASPDSFLAERRGRSATATVSPPSPFAGSGSFAASADGAVSWTGDLSVAFPGTDPVRLTGKRFEVSLCVDRRCAGDLERSSGIFVATGRRR